LVGALWRKLLNFKVIMSIPINPNLFEISHLAPNMESPSLVQLSARDQLFGMPIDSYIGSRFAAIPAYSLRTVTLLARIHIHCN